MDGHLLSDPLAIDDDVREGLERMAERSARTPSDLANAVLRDLVHHDEELRASISRGLADVAAGRVMDTDELRRRLEDRRRRRALG